MNEQNLDSAVPKSQYNSYSALLEDMQNFLAADAEEEDPSGVARKNALQNETDQSDESTEAVKLEAATDKSKEAAEHNEPSPPQIGLSAASENAPAACDFTQSLAPNYLHHEEKTTKKTSGSKQSEILTNRESEATNYQAPDPPNENILSEIKNGSETKSAITEFDHLADQTMNIDENGAQFNTTGSPSDLVSELRETNFENEFDAGQTKLDAHFQALYQLIETKGNENSGDSNNDFAASDEFALPDQTFLSLEDITLPEPTFFQEDNSIVPEPPLTFGEPTFALENSVFEKSLPIQDEHSNVDSRDASENSFLENEIAMPTFVLEQTADSFSTNNSAAPFDSGEFGKNKTSEIESNASENNFAHQLFERSSENSIDESIAENYSQGFSLEPITASVLEAETIVQSNETASAFAKRKTAAAAIAPVVALDLKERYIVFRLDNQLYAFSAMNIAEVGHPLPVTPLPFVPSWFLGIANLRGDILSVIGLRELWNKKPIVQQKAKMLILRSHKNDLTIGVMVDGIREMRHILSEEINAVDESLNEKNNLFQIGNVSFEGEKLQLLDAEKLLGSLNL